MAKSQVKINFPNLPKGDPIAIPGVGEVPNGETQTVDEFQVETWENFTGEKWPEGGLVLPAPTPEPNETDAQTEGQIQAAIIKRQNARTEKQVQEEADAQTDAIRRGEWIGPVLVDGKVVANSKAKDPVDAVSQAAPASAKEKN